MRFRKLLSILTILCLLCATIPAALGDELVIEPMEIEPVEDVSDDGDLQDIELDFDGDEIEEMPEEALIIEPDLEEIQEVAPAEQTFDAPDTDENSDFEIDEDGVLVKYNGFEKNVVIPDGVKEIGNGAFEDDLIIVSVSIPNDVTNIGDKAFSGCSNLVSVSIPDSVTHIGNDAFYGCSNLVSVNIPSGVTYIGNCAFFGCSNLKSITIPNSVSETGWYVFSYCSSLTDVQLSDNMTELAGNLFWGCESLKKIVLPNGITRIGSGAFGQCDGLESISIPSSVTTIEDGAFSECNSLKDIIIPEGVTTIEESTFFGCNGLKDIIIPNWITKIEKNAFSYCYNLESVTIPANVAAIDRGAFNCSENVVIRGTAGSYAEKFANGMGIPFNAPVVTFNKETLREARYIYDDDTGTSDNVWIVHISETRALKAVQKPSDLATTLKWSSSNTEVATVDQNGNVKGIAKGHATITAATADGKGKAAQIKIYVPKTTEVSFENSDSKEVVLGKTIEICVQVETPYSDYTGTDFPISWSISDKSIVSIESTEKVSSSWCSWHFATLKGNKMGKATITATTPDGGKATITVEVLRPDPDNVSIKQTGPITLHIGETFTLNASVSPAEAIQAVTWTSYDKSVATVSTKGVIKAVAEGWTQIEVKPTTGSGWAYIDVYVIPVHPHPESIKINQSGPIQLVVGKTYALTTTMTPADAVAALTWSSDDTSVAKVSKTGVVTAVAPGWTWINVETDNWERAYIEVYVVPAPTKVTLNKTAATLPVGGTVTLKTTLSPSDAETDLTWKSDKPAVATVSKSGKVTAVKQGTATITVTTHNGKTASATITVKPAVTGVKLNKTAATLAVKDTLSLAATLSPSNAYPTLTWKSSKPAVATVSKSGKVTAVKQGTATITATTHNGKTASATITVKPAVTGVKLNKTAATLAVKDTLSLAATLSPSNAYPTLAWKSSKPAVATVSKSGKVTAVKQGTATITATAHNGKTASATITVKPAVTKVKLNKSKASLAVKETLKLKATLSPSNALSTLTWKSSKPAVATVDKSGKVTAVKQGTATITATAHNGKTATAVITVKPAASSVKLNKSKATLGVKEPLALSATVKPSNALTTLTWKSSKPAVAKVDKSGNVTPLKAGTATITVTTSNGKTASATITVKPAPKKVTLNKKGTVSLKKGKTLQLKAKLTSGSASALTWTSSKKSVAKVDKNGKVTALKKGTATITVETFNGRTATVKIKVK